VALITLKYGASAQSRQIAGPEGQVAATLDRVSADPLVAPVSPGEEISFQLGPDSPQGDLVITFNEPQFFSAPYFRAGDPPVSLTGNLDHTTFYKCELFVNGMLIASGDGAEGGGVEPSGHFNKT
jgi:hypothetical protein